MYQLTRDGLTNTRQGYLFTYVQIAFNQTRRFVNLMEPPEPVSGWMKYTQEDQRDAERLECRIMAVLATALFLEAYIYDYGARKESAAFIEKYVDKLDPVAKWIVIPKLVSPPGLNRDDDVFERLRRLFKIRNELVHHKTKPGENFEAPPEFPSNMEPNECIKLIVDLLRQLHELDPAEDFADFVIRHIHTWIDYTAKDTRFYPILWEA